LSESEISAFVNGCEKGSQRSFNPDSLDWIKLKKFYQDGDEIEVTTSSIDFCNAYSTFGKTYRFTMYAKSSAIVARGICKRFNGKLLEIENASDVVIARICLAKINKK